MPCYSSFLVGATFIWSLSLCGAGRFTVITIILLVVEERLHIWRGDNLFGFRTMRTGAANRSPFARVNAMGQRRQAYEFIHKLIASKRRLEISLLS